MRTGAIPEPIHIVAVDRLVTPALLGGVADVLRQVLGLESHLAATAPAARPAFDDSRGQFEGLQLLDLLGKWAPFGEEKVLGVLATDLFIPMLTHVFGQAELGGRVAVVSAYRLDPLAYGLGADASLLADRLQKEAVHEVGHLFGLPHCARVGCVMHSSTDVTELDTKSLHLCRACSAGLSR